MSTAEDLEIVHKAIRDEGSKQSRESDRLKGMGLSNAAAHASGMAAAYEISADMIHRYISGAQ